MTAPVDPNEFAAALAAARREELRLVLLIEEASEVQKAACKAFRFGLDGGQHERGQNRRDLETECGDLCAVMDALAAAGDISWARVLEARARHAEKLRRYLPLDPTTNEGTVTKPEEPDLALVRGVSPEQLERFRRDVMTLNWATIGAMAQLAGVDRPHALALLFTQVAAGRASAFLMLFCRCDDFSPCLVTRYSAGLPLAPIRCALCGVSGDLEDFGYDVLAHLHHGKAEP